LNYQAHQWVSKAKLNDLPQATLARKSLELLL
ncbi:MAG: hypothetical protein ACKVK6_04430, partial [bacterium]